MSDAQRPDPSDPTRIPSATFATVRRGWDPDAVRAFLTAVAAELQRAHGRIAELEAAAPAAVDLSALPDDEIARLVGEETAAVLATAREGATALRLRAEAKATELLDDAAAEANRVREAASEDAARRRTEAAEVAAAEIADAKERGREMVAEANRHRDQVSAALEQRRRAARDWAQEVEVEQRRLLEVFERARAVADDVVARLRPAPVSIDDADLRGDTRAVVESAITAAGDTAADAAGGAVYDLATEDGSDQVTSPDAEADIAVDTEGDDDGDVNAGSNVVHLFGAEPAPEAATDAAVTPEPDEAADGETSVGELFARLRDEIADGDATNESSSSGDGETTSSEESTAADADEDSDDGPVAARDAALNSVLTQAVRKAKRVLADEQNAVLELLADGTGVGDIADLVPGPDEHAAGYIDAVTPMFDRVCAVAAELTGGETPAPSSDASRWVVTGLVDPLRERLTASITAADGDAAALTKRLRALYRDVKTNVVGGAVTDAMLAVHAEAVVASSPDGTALRWVADPQARACPDCEDNVLAGAQTAGTPFPTGHVAAPAHSGCRCALIPADR
ncbi:MAG: hypothetical protein EBS20_09585, partial [Actinobacteria bacterium]|nr:hypothetical protein [Actinomycetota bacterium]